LIVLAWWSVAHCLTILYYGRASFSVHIHISMITIWMESFKQTVPSRWLNLNLHFISSFFIVDVLKIHMRAHYIFYKTYLSCVLLQFISSCNLKSPYAWFKHCIFTNPTDITQCKHYSIEIVINYQNHTWGLHALSLIGFGFDVMWCKKCSLDL
jgi:hypothetical protein